MTMFERKMREFESYLYEKAMHDLFCIEYIDGEFYEPNDRYRFLQGAACVLDRDPEDMFEDYYALLGEINPSFIAREPERPCPFGSEFVEMLRDYYEENEARYKK